LEVGIIVLGVDRTGAAADIININMIIGAGGIERRIKNEI